MTVNFLEPTPHPSSDPPSAVLAGTFDWRRPASVALVATITAILHGALLFWYLQRPKPAVMAEAVPLPMIDIALTAPSNKAPASPQPVSPPKPIPPKPQKPKPKPKAKPKPKPVKQPKRTSEIKKPIPQKTEPKPVAVTESTPTPPVAAPTPTPTITGSHQSNRSLQNQSSAVVPANANAAYLNNPKPNYPRIARKRHWQGRVVLRVKVTADGRCAQLSVHRSSGHDALDKAALDAVRQWRFVPGSRGGIAVASWVNVPVEFALN